MSTNQKLQFRCARGQHQNEWNECLCVTLRRTRHTHTHTHTERHHNVNMSNHEWGQEQEGRLEELHVMWSEVISVGDLTQTRSWSLRSSLRANWSCNHTFQQRINRELLQISQKSHMLHTNPLTKSPLSFSISNDLSTSWIHGVLIQSCSPGQVTRFHYSRFERR